MSSINGNILIENLQGLRNHLCIAIENATSKGK